MSLFKVISKDLKTQTHPDSSAAHDLSGRPLGLYGPLPTLRSIRLLEFLPVTFDVVKCTLHIAHLDSNPTYDALSYTWGAPGAPRFQYRKQFQFTIHCNGRVVRVSQNLFNR